MTGFEHDLVSPLDRRVRCFLCKKPVTPRVAFTASLDFGFPLHMHSECARRTPIAAIESRYRACVNLIVLDHRGAA